MRNLLSLYSETVKHVPPAVRQVVTTGSRFDDGGRASIVARRFEMVRGRKLVDQNPVAVWAIADRLPQAEGRWSPFAPPAALRQLDLATRCGVTR